MGARLFAAALAALLACALSPSVARAQSAHAHHPPPAPAPAPKPRPKPKPKPKPAAPAPTPAVDPHDAHDAHAGHVPAPTAPAPDPHAAHGAPTPAHQATVVPVPPPTDADRAAAQPPRSAHAAHGDSPHWRVTAEALEWASTDEGDRVHWDVDAWIGGDVHRLRLRSEGERDADGPTHAAAELLYGRLVSPWWELQAGARLAPGAEAALAVGASGTAPYKIEVEALGWVGAGGHAGARVEAGYETLFTQRLVLASTLELQAASHADAEQALGRGLTRLEAGLRLRYEVTPRFAPYLGLVHERALGESAGLRRDAGRAVRDTQLVLGLHAWF